MNCDFSQFAFDKIVIISKIERGILTECVIRFKIKANQYTKFCTLYKEEETMSEVLYQKIGITVDRAGMRVAYDRCSMPEP